MKLELTDSPSTQDKKIVELGVSAHADKNNHSWDNKELAVFYRDDNGTPVAGLVGETYWGCLHVKHIWVSESLRGQGIGRSLLATAEEEAKYRGCTSSALDTFSFQSPEFYDKAEYKVIGQMNDFPKGQTRLFYVKKL